MITHNTSLMNADQFSKIWNKYISNLDKMVSYPQ